MTKRSFRSPAATKSIGIYVTDTLSPSKLLHFTLSARDNRNTETLNGYSINTNIGDFGAGIRSGESFDG